MVLGQIQQIVHMFDTHFLDEVLGANPPSGQMAKISFAAQNTFLTLDSISVLDSHWPHKRIYCLFYRSYFLPCQDC